MEDKAMEQDLVEISIVELFQELWRRRLIIAACAIVCAVVSAVCAYVNKPSESYSYIARLQVPLNTGGWQINTCAEILRSDIGKTTGLTAVRQVPNSHVLMLTFNGPDGETLRKSAEEYMIQSKKRVEDVLAGGARENFRTKVQSDFRKYLATTNAAADPEIAPVAAELEKLLTAKMEEKTAFPVCELILPDGAEFNKPSGHIARTVVFAVIGGLIVCCGCIVCRYVYKKTTA